MILGSRCGGGVIGDGESVTVDPELPASTLGLRVMGFFSRLRWGLGCGVGRGRGLGWGLRCPTLFRCLCPITCFLYSPKFFNPCLAMWRRNTFLSLSNSAPQRTQLCVAFFVRYSSGRRTNVCMKSALTYGQCSTVKFQRFQIGMKKERNCFLIHNSSFLKQLWQKETQFMIPDF